MLFYIRRVSFFLHGKEEMMDVFLIKAKLICGLAFHNMCFFFPHGNMDDFQECFSTEVGCLFFYMETTVKALL
jgi:hypothetical protein